MKDQEKFIALIRLRDMLYFGVKPTLRQCGLAPETVDELTEERLIQLGDRRFGDRLDRYTIETILPGGKSFITEHHLVRERLSA